MVEADSDFYGMETKSPDAISLTIRIEKKALAFTPIDFQILESPGKDQKTGERDTLFLDDVSIKEETLAQILPEVLEFLKDKQINEN